VSVTNEIYEYLNQPKEFLFCPTQYCASRAGIEFIVNITNQLMLTQMIFLKRL